MGSKRECEGHPPANEVEWTAKPNGRYYEEELLVGIDVVKRRAGNGVVVRAQTWYYAVREACRELQLAPEHITVEKKNG